MRLKSQLSPTTLDPITQTYLTRPNSVPFNPNSCKISPIPLRPDLNPLKPIMMKSNGPSGNLSQAQIQPQFPLLTKLALLPKTNSLKPPKFHIITNCAIHSKIIHNPPHFNIITVRPQRFHIITLQIMNHYRKKRKKKKQCFNKQTNITKLIFS